MDSLDFLNNSPTGRATLHVCYSDGTSAQITGLDLDLIHATSPLLALAFEEGRSGPRHYIEDVSQAALACFLRYIYTRPSDYVPESCKADRLSLQLHTHVYHLAKIYDVPGLQALAKTNVMRECEFSCSMRSSPVDLCEAIVYVYSKLPSHVDMVDTLINYCATMFLYHRLGDDAGFRRLAYEHRTFQQDLCAINITRGFVDDAALAIVQLPIKPYRGQYRNSVESSILKHVLYDMWAALGDVDLETKVSAMSTFRNQASVYPLGIPIVYRDARHAWVFDSVNPAPEDPTIASSVEPCSTEMPLTAQETMTVSVIRRPYATDPDCSLPFRVPKPSQQKPVLFGPEPNLAQEVAERLITGDPRPSAVQGFTARVSRQKKAGFSPLYHAPNPQGDSQVLDTQIASLEMLSLNQGNCISEPLTDTPDEDDDFVHIDQPTDDDWHIL